MRYASVDGVRLSASETQATRALCLGCDSEVVAKRGQLVSHHWAHKSSQDCDSWYDPRNMTDWHRDWQDRFPADSREITMGGQREHRADVYLINRNLTVEFQHSALAASVILERSEFYTRDSGILVWVFDASTRKWAWTLSILRDFTTDGRVFIVLDFSENDCRFRWLDHEYRVTRDILVEMLSHPEHNAWSKALDIALEADASKVQAIAASVIRGPFASGPSGEDAGWNNLLALALLDARGMNPFPAFLVAPADEIDSYYSDLGDCFPEWTITPYRGPRRKKLSTRYKVYLIPWGTFCNDMECEPRAATLPSLLNHIIPRTVIYDDGHGLVDARNHPIIAARKLARSVKFVFPIPPTRIQEGAADEE